ncbi:MAG: DUF5050 domain-containing protein [Spirochaetia bacterium]|nr:DUF5050 domain-containing protein [Spirochaetia bacterium]
MKKISVLVFLLALQSAGICAAGDAAAIAYFWSFDGGEHGQIYVMKTDGTQPTQITNIKGMDFSMPSVSPDGSRLLAFGGPERHDDPTKYGLYLMDIDGGNVKKVSACSHEGACASWFPDSKTFVYSVSESGKFRVYRSDIYGKAGVPLTNGLFNYRAPAVSPDGRIIALESDREEKNTGAPDGSDTLSYEEYDEDTAVADGKRIPYNNDGLGKIYVMDAHGKGLKRLTNAGTRYSRPFWIPSGKQLCFFRGEYPNVSVWAMAPDGKGQQELLALPENSMDGSVAWAGAKMVISMAYDAFNPSELRLFPFDGTDNRILPLTTDRGNYYDPSAVAVGGKDFYAMIMDDKHTNSGLIAYASWRLGDIDVYVCRPDGSLRRRLTNSRSALEPSISHDRTRVLYVDYQDGDSKKPNQIFMVNIDGSGKRQLTAGTAYNSRAKWSPDDKKILFVGVEPGKKTEIWVMDADGSNPKRLTDNDCYDDTPSWSPDGKSIVYTSIRDKNERLWIMDADGGNARQLTKHDGKENDATPCWSPDGKTILFSRSYTLMTINSDGTGEKKLDIGVKGDEAVWSPDGKRIAFRPRESHTGIFTADADGKNTADIEDLGFDSSGPSWQ